MEVYYLTGSLRGVLDIESKLKGSGINIHQVGKAMLNSKISEGANSKEIAMESVNTAYRMQIFPAICYTHEIVHYDDEHRLEDYLAYKDDGDKSQVFTGVIEGTKLENPKGIVRDYIFDRDGQLFIPRGHDKTIAQFNGAEYLTWKESLTEKQSAELQFVNWIKERIQQARSKDS